MKNALIIYSAPAFLLNVPMSWEIFLNIKSQVKFKHYFHPPTTRFSNRTFNYDLFSDDLEEERGKGIEGQKFTI